MLPPALLRHYAITDAIDYAAVIFFLLMLFFFFSMIDDTPLRCQMPLR